MRAIKYFIGIILLSFIFILPSQASASDDEITILFTHDLHDNFYPFNITKDGEKKSVGGYARLFNVIQAEKELDPDAILVDAGDYSMGSLFQTVNMEDAPELRMMGLLGYDVTTFGNHEFDYRAKGLAKSLMAAKKSKDKLPQIVSSNMVVPDEPSDVEKLKEAMEEYGVSPYTVIERKGLKFGFIGLMGKEADEDAPMSGVEFENIVEASKPIVKKLKDEEEVDIIIALSHSGTFPDPKDSEDEILAKEVPDIDVVISGHTHSVLSEPIIHGDTSIVSSGEYGKNLGKLVLKRNSEAAWEVSDYEIIPIDDSIKPNKKVENKIKSFKKMVQNEYLDQYNFGFDEVLAHSSFDFREFTQLGKALREEPIGNLIGDAYLHTIQEIEGGQYEPIAAAVIPVGVIRDTIVRGDVTTSDVFDISPLGIGPDERAGYPVVEIYLTGKELKTVAEVDASVSPIMRDAQLYVAGMSYTINPHRMIFNKVTDPVLQDMSGQQTEIDSKKLYRVVAGLYSAQMLPVVKDKSFNLLSIEPKDKEGNIIENFEDEIIYIDEELGLELKEWYAIANYLTSLDQVEGVPEIPNYYQDDADRKIVEASWNPVKLFKQPNFISLIIYGVIIVGLVVIVSMIRWFIRRRRRKNMFRF